MYAKVTLKQKYRPFGEISDIDFSGKFYFGNIRCSQWCKLGNIANISVLVYDYYGIAAA